MPIIIARDNGDLILPGPAEGQPMTTSLKKLFVGGRQKGPMLTADGVTPLTVLGEDERERRRDTDQPPLRMICSIEVAFAGDPVPQPIGTGWLVGPRTVVTAGHVLRWEGSEAVRVNVIPGRDEAVRPVGFRKSTSFHFHPRWSGETANPAGTDIAAIRLPTPFAGVSWFGIAALTDPSLDERFVNIAGYPSEVEDQNPGCVELWWHANRIKELASDRIFYDVDTSPGQSGAPVMLWPDPSAASAAAPTVVGIHARGESAASPGLNGATRINGAMLAMIGGWIDADNAA